MSYQPVVIGTGIAGWRFLQATMERQEASFAASTTIRNDADYFARTIGKIHSAEALVSDRRLLAVALGAFGLGDDIDNRFFLRRILEEGTSARDALANRLADSRYADFSRAFGFGPDETPQTGLPDFSSSIISRFQSQSFEQAVGTQNEAMRVALFTNRELSDPTRMSRSDDAAWFKMMAAPPLRQFFETALGFPSAISQLDLDKQLEMFRAKARQTFGTDRFEDLKSPVMREKMTNLFLARDQALSASKINSPASVALTLLGGLT